MRAWLSSELTCPHVGIPRTHTKPRAPSGVSRSYGAGDALKKGGEEGSDLRRSSRPPGRWRWGGGVNPEGKRATNCKNTDVGTGEQGSPEKNLRGREPAAQEHTCAPNSGRTVGVGEVMKTKRLPTSTRIRVPAGAAPSPSVPSPLPPRSAMPPHTPRG